MFEGLVRQLIWGYLGKYIKDIQKEQLKITLWNEEVLLENVELILEAFDYLRLPLAFKQGRVGKLSIKIPWKKLGWDPIIIILEDVYICVSQRDDKEWSMDAIKRREYASKKAQLAAAELAKLSRRVCDNQTGKSFISYITAKILDSIQVSIRNVHVLYCEKRSAEEEMLFGLKFSSLTIMKQTAFVSTTAKVKAGQVNKLIEIQNLELYCDTSGKADYSKMENAHCSNSMGREELEDNKYSSILAPLNVSVSLSVNRSGKLLNDAPQYTVNIELASMATSMDDVQLQQILSLLDYVSICQLRENYGCYRPWWSPLEEKLKGWQKAWWHYAQESVLSDVRRRLRRTSWKYFGERLNSRRKYVNLYKAKLKCLRHDQVIDEDVQRQLEEMEKGTDIEDILNYRAVAEQELEDFLVTPSSKCGSNGGNMDKSVEDDQPPSKPRGWLNWLSYGMLGAGGTDVTNQFSGVISDDVIKDIYEATKFHPAPVVFGDSAMVEEVYFSSVKIIISEIHTKLRSMKLGQNISDLMLNGISIEAKVREKSAVITASVNSAKMLNPFNSQIILSSKKMNSEDDVFEKQLPSLNIKVEMPQPSSDITLSVKVTLGPTELFCDSEFLKNILDFLDVLHHMSFQQQRILLSLNGIDDLNSRLLSKLDYVLSSRKKITWDINLLNTAINIPWEHADIGGHNMVVEIAVISLTSEPEIDSSAFHIGDTSHLLHYVGSGPTGDSEFGFQLENLYDHFEILISDTEINLIMPSSATLPLFEKFCASASMVSCILPDEPVLKVLEAHVQVPSLIAHFSASVYGEIMGLISQFKMLLPSDSSDSLKQKSNGLKTSENTWFSIDASLDAISLLVNLEDNLVDGCTLNLNSQKLGVWYDQRDFPDCRVSLQACQVTASSRKDDWENHVLFSSIRGSGSVNQHNMSVDGQNGYLEDETSLAARCILLHFEAVRNTPWILQKYTICASDLEIHCHPLIVRKLIVFFDEIAVYGEYNVDGKKSSVEDRNSPIYGFELQKHSVSNETGFSESANIPLDHFPLSIFEDFNLENLVDDTRLRFSKTLNLRDQKLRPSKVSLPDRTMMLLGPRVNSNLDSGSSVCTFINRDSVLVNMNLGSITVHFHDASCIIGTIVVPLAKSAVTISEDMLDIVCSTEGVFLSTSWWPKIINEFLWGPLSSNLSPILNLSLKKRNIPSQNSHSDLSFYIQHVSCILPPDFLAMLIGYFSLPDWSPYELVRPTDTMDTQDSIKLSFEIVDCNVIIPADNDFYRLLQIDIKQLSVAFSESSDKSSLTKNIPSSCCISAGKFSDRNQCLDFFGCDLSLSVLLLGKDVVNPLDRCQKLVLVASLTADVWVRIPYYSDTDSAYPVCIMALVNDCLIDIEEESTIIGLDALGYVIDQFSLVEQESKMFTNDVLQFLQIKKQIMEHSALLPKSSDITTNEMRFCVRSLSLRLHQLKRDSTCSEIMAEAEMHFVCSVSLINGKPHFFDISFSSISLFSLLNSVALAEFSCTDSGLSVLDMILAVSGHDENRIVLSFPSLDVWLYLPDWNEVFDLLVSFSKKMSTKISGASAEDLSSVTVDNRQSVASDSQNQVLLEDISQAAGSSILTLEHVGLSIHFPALVSRDVYNTFGRPHVHKLPCDDGCGSPSDYQNCFISISLQSRNSELVADGKSVKLAINSDYTGAVLKLLSGDIAQSWPLFQLSKIYIEAEIYEYQTENLSMNLFIRSDSLDLSLGNHILYLFYFTWFEKHEDTPSQFNIKRMDIKAQLRRLSLHLNDWKTSNGPLLEFLVRNSSLWSTVSEDEIEVSIGCDLQVNYYNIDKVLWEPFLEPWKFQLSMSRKQDERALFSGTIMTDINLESKTHLNLNLNEPIVEVVSRAIEMVKDAWSLTEMTESPDLPNLQITKGAGARRYAPYMLQNLTTLPLLYACQQKVGADDLDVSPSKGVLQPGSSTLIYINESPEELLFRYRPVQSSDRLNDKQSLEAAHRYVTFQLEGTSVPSAPISMDLVGRSYFEVQFLKSSHVPEFHSDANSVRSKMSEVNGGADAIKGFAIPVVIDVSVQRFTKLMRLYSTVVILNSTSVVLEVRFDIPFGLSPKILGPIYPGQEFPLPLHLAESGCIRWRPIGDSYLWSEAYNISSIISRDVKIGFLRSFVCYPSLPSSEAFRCCISVNGQCLSPVGCGKKAYSAIDVDIGKQCQDSHSQSSNNLEIRNRLLYQVMLTSPLVLKNYLMKSMSVTLEDAGVTRTVFLSEVETSFYHIDSSHDFSITFQMHGFKPSTLKYPRAESFSEKARFSGTKFSVTEMVKFESEFSNGPLYVTMEKVMDAVSGSRELFISVPFLLYNCTGFPLALSSSGNEMKGYSCIIPSCYDLDDKNVLVKKKDGLSLIFSDQDVPASGSTSGSNMNTPDLVKNGSKKVSACLFTPDPDSYSGEVMVKLSRHVPSVIENLQKRSWSAPFSLIPPTGSTSVLVPQPSKVSGYVLSVSAVAAPFSGRTKIITFQPRYVIVNACTKILCYKQKGTDSSFHLEAGKHSYIQWMDSKRELLLSVCFDEPGWEWSGCFLPEQLGDTQLKVRNYMTTAVCMLRVEVRNADVSVGEEKIVGSTTGNSGTNLILLSDDDTGFMPYRIDNHSRERLRIYQPKCESFETVIHSYTSTPYAWDEPCYPHRLIVEVPGERILGSYAIDDVSANSLVYLPATSEKPERKLLISVHSEGAIKVLSIIDSSYHVLNDLKRLHVPQLKENGKQAQEYESFVNYKEKVSVDIPFLGISLMNSHPEEILFASAKNTKLTFVQSLDKQQFSLQIASLQIDNQLRTTPYPVILSFNTGNKGNMVNGMKLKDSSKVIGGSSNQTATSSLHEPVFSFDAAKWRNTETSLVSFESISLRMADLYLEIDQEIALRLFEFCKTVSSRLQSRVYQYTGSPQNLLFPELAITGETSRNSPFTARLGEKYTNNSGTTILVEDQKRKFLLPNIVPIGAPWQQIHLSARKQKKVYVELFDMGPIKLTLSFSSSPWILRDGVLTSGESIIHRGLMALADVEGAKIHFKELVLSHQIASWETIQEILVSHYTRQFLHEMYKVFGSAGVIGNPVGFARSLGLGIKDFFSLPIWSVIQSPAGLISGMAQGTTSLLSNTVYAISDATSQFSKAAHKGIVAFTFDDQTATTIERQQKGMSSRSKGVINEFLEGLTGVLQSPIKGAEKHGLPGVLSGIAVGVTGLVARPAASILEVTGKTAQSIRNRSKIHQMGYRCFRVRLPRPLSAESPLKPYSWDEAVGTYILTETDVNLRDETLVVCKALKQSGQYVLITGRLILVVSCPSLIESDGVPADPKWEILSEIGLDSVILADNDGEVVHIVGSGSDTTSFRQNLQHQKRGNEAAKGKLWNSSHMPHPFLQTNLELASDEEAVNFLRVLRGMIDSGREQGWGAKYILHQSNIS